jgi:hypothetical protein
MARRNNDERQGAAPQDDAPPASAVSKSPTGLNFVVPTEVVDLPSKGKFYPEGHPLFGKETLEVRHMTAKEEDILTSRTLLKKGLAIDRMLESVIVEPGVSPDHLLIGDKNAVIVATRIAAYGSEYNTKVTCPVCASVEDFSFNLHESDLSHPDDNQTPEFDSTERSTFLINLPKSSVTAEVRLLTGQDEKWLAKMADNKKKHGLGDATLTDQMRVFVVSLNGIDDKGQINQFIDSMPAADSRHLRNVYKTLSPNIDLTQDFACTSCGGESRMEVPFTSDFFWPQ